MKLKVLFLLLCISICSLFIPKIYAQNWTPLEIGNKWQFFNQTYYYSTPWPSLTNVEVKYDTIINGKVYYWKKSVRQGLSTYVDSILQRYDSGNKILYAYNLTGDSEYVYMDFNLEAGDTIEIPQSIGFLRIVITGTDNLFGNIIQYKGYKTYEWYPYNSYNTSRYTNDFGIFYEYGYYEVPGFGPYDADSHLIQSIVYINGAFQNHSHQGYPIINFEPVTSIPDSSFQLSFLVDHFYSRRYLPYGGNDSLLFNYIDSVLIENYYSNGTTTINNQPIFIMNVPNEKEYTLDTVLNLNLLTNGYNFYYRIKAIDRGIIPHTTFSPLTGYYEVFYDTTTRVDDLDNQPINFNLSQNYPNPFNPTTKIKYTIPSFTRIELKVFDMLGREVAALVNEGKPAGEYETEFNGASLPSGIYFYQLKALDPESSSGQGFIETKKMVLLR